jgi:hypothetical protein
LHTPDKGKEKPVNHEEGGLVYIGIGALVVILIIVLILVVL